MAMPLAREWVGIQQFPVATQNKLVELLGKLKGEVVFTFRYLSSSAIKFLLCSS